jgi:hypothetical protein
LTPVNSYYASTTGLMLSEDFGPRVAFGLVQSRQLRYSGIY